MFFARHSSILITHITQFQAMTQNAIETQLILLLESHQQINASFCLNRNITLLRNKDQSKLRIQ